MGNKTTPKAIRSSNHAVLRGRKGGAHTTRRAKEERKYPDRRVPRE